MAKSCDSCIYGYPIGGEDLYCELHAELKMDYDWVACDDFKEED